MGAGLEVLTRSAKRSYEERKITSQKGIDTLLFPVPDIDISSSFLLDTYISNPYAVAYVDPSNQSVVREFKNGSGQLVTPPIAKAKTPIDESLRDQITSGQEATASQVMQTASKVDRIIGDHLEGHAMTKWYQALNVVRTGIFTALGKGGTDLGLNITYTRIAGNTLTYDFTATGATMAEALKEPQDQLRSQNTPMSRNICIMGQSWLTNFSTDTNILELRKANTENVIVSSQMEAPELLGVQGLVIHSILRDPAMVAPMWICSFAPGSQYVPYEGATPEDWIADTEAIFFSLDDRRYTVDRGIDAFNGAGQTVRVAGGIVADSFNTDDPITEIIRTQTRHAFVPGNINHTAKSTGTFE
jgi:hypothetical protein